MDKEKLYKTLTLIISIISLIILFVSGIYFEYYKKREVVITNLKNKLDDFQKRKEELSAIPIIEIKVLSFKDSKLPDYAFERLKLIPSIIQISHISGKLPAKDIDFEIKVSENIVSHVTSHCEDLFNVNSMKSSIKIGIPKFRLGSKIETIIYTKNLPEINTAFISENAIIKSLSKTNNAEYQYDINWEIISPYQLSNVDEINILIKRLKDEIIWQRTRPIIDYQEMLLVLIIILYFTPFVVYIYRRIRDRKISKAIVNLNNNKLLQKGISVHKIEELLGKPKYIKIPTEGQHANCERWAYEPQPFPFAKALPDLYLIVKNKKIIDYYYHFLNSNYICSIKYFICITSGSS